MGDFNVNLSAPQGAGAQALQPVETARQAPIDFSGLSDAVTIFAKGLADNKKADAEARKNAVIKEYVNSEKVYTDALTSGQWNAAQVGMASRANYTKMISSYPEYMTELVEAKKSVYDGTETGEAQKKVDREMALREQDKKDASDKGFTIPPGSSEEYTNQVIDAAKYERRLEVQTEKRNKEQAELRAQRSDERSGETHQETMLQIQRKEEARQGLVTMADKNFDVLGSLVKDLVADTKMPFEQKSFFLSGQVNRIKQGLLAVASTNPEMAGPWQKLVEDMDMQAQKMMDPKVKSADEAKRAQDEWNAMVANAKIMAISKNPHLMKYVVGSELFKDPTQITLMGSADIKEWLSGAGSGDPANKPTTLLGTPNEKKALKVLEKAINDIDAGKVDPVKATQEAINVTNEIMKQTSQLDGSISPAALKDLGSFYGSPAFGRLSTAGKVDMPTMQNAKKVFQVAYEPAVRTAIIEKLETQVGEKGETLAKNVDVVMSGNGVEFKPKANSNASSEGFINGWISNGMRGNDITAGKYNLKAAQEGLNTLIRIGAHMEGTTDYGKYWEANKHRLLPNVFPDPVKLKEGDVVDGYKYMGGAYNDKRNWKRADTSK